MAVWLGFVIIAAVLLGVRPPLPRFSWATDGEFAATVSENKPTVEKLIKDAEAKERRILRYQQRRSKRQWTEATEGDRRRLQNLVPRQKDERQSTQKGCRH
jgi:hypothetical protein